MENLSNTPFLRESAHELMEIKSALDLSIDVFKAKAIPEIADLIKVHGVKLYLDIHTGHVILNVLDFLQREMEVRSLRPIFDVLENALGEPTNEWTEDSWYYRAWERVGPETFDFLCKTFGTGEVFF